MNENEGSSEESGEQQRRRLGELNSKIFKIEQSIYFSNCEFFHENFYKKYDELSHSEHVVLIEKMGGRWMQATVRHSGGKVTETTALNNEEADQSDSSLPDCVLDFSAVNYVDTNGVKMLANLIEDFEKINVYIYICQPQGIFNYKK
jgi:MFS superfamily sulfate permease-like transporter